MIQVRRLTADDAPAYREFRLRGLREHPDAFTSSYEDDSRLPIDKTVQRLAGAGQRFWGAFDGDVLVGALGLECGQRVKERHKGKVIGMYVVPEATGRGAGRALVDALVADARGLGLEVLVLTVTHGNDRATRLYERAGFRSFGIEPLAMKIDGRTFAKNHMVLELAP